MCPSSSASVEKSRGRTNCLVFCPSGRLGRGGPLAASDGAGFGLAGVSRETLQVGCKQPAHRRARYEAFPSAPGTAGGAVLPATKDSGLRPRVPLVSAPLLPLPLPGAGQAGETGLEVLVV